MADHFITKTRISSEVFSEAGGKDVLERHAELRALLEDRAGPEVAALFAEPLISRGNDEAAATIAWYADVEGTARPLSALPPSERAAAETFLAAHLRPLKALLSDADTGPLVRSALDVPNEDAVWVVGDHPILINWGLLPAEIGADEAARAAHFDTTLGRFLPMLAPTDATKPAAPAMKTVPPAGAAAAPVAPVAAVAHSAATPIIVDDARARPISRLAWVPLLVLLLIAGAVLLWILMPGNRLFPVDARTDAITDAAALEAAQRHNQDLRDRRAALQDALDTAVCRADGTLVLPDGRTPDGLLPYSPRSGAGKAGQAADVPPTAILPSHANRIVVPDPASDQEKADEIPLLALSKLIEERTVLVLVMASGGVEIGSGFSLGNGQIVTNSHVVEDARDTDAIYVINKTLGKPIAAQVLKSSGPLESEGEDFALLKMDGATLPAFPVVRPETSLKLNNVVAAGFPGDMIEIDAAFAEFRAGNVQAVPELTLTDGTINTEQKLGERTSVLMHSAALSTGNSGGPLVDMCGRVVGVNTFVRSGRLQNRNFALSSLDLLRFLDSSGAAPVVVSGACTPVVLRPGAKVQGEKEGTDAAKSTPDDKAPAEQDASKTKKE